MLFSGIVDIVLAAIILMAGPARQRGRSAFAAAVDQTPAQLMATILARAAGR
jgi:hypothetical protein